MSTPLGSMRRLVVVAGTLALVGGAGAGAAWAGVSDGNYHYAEQGCGPDSEHSDQADQVDEGCQSFTVHVSDGAGHEYARVGTRQTPEGEVVHQADATTDFGSLGDPASGARLYLGADDNLDVGEHDGSEHVHNGPSDGGAIQANVTPGSVETWLGAIAESDVGYLLTHPLPLADFGMGACADGICFAVQTQERLAYQGTGEGERHVADYEGKEWDPESCSGPDDGPEDCDDPSTPDTQEDLGYWHGKEGSTYVEPGVQIYEDPDPQGSPIGPYPLPAAYVGTCGVILGGGGAEAPSSPVTNTAGQVEVGTGC